MIFGKARRRAPEAPPPTTGGRLVYAVGDVHGRADLLEALLGTIGRDREASAHVRPPILIFCGDYVDRGPGSSHVLETLVQLRADGAFELRLLKGNHEQAMLEFIDEPAARLDWLDFGGAETLASYDVRPLSLEDGPAEPVRARDELLARMPPGHLALLNGLELMTVVGDYAFVHAGVRPGVALDRQIEDDLLWIRDDFLGHTVGFEKTIVHGHSWRDDAPQVLPHRIGVDTGAYATGVLTAVRLEDEKQSFLYAR